MATAGPGKTAADRAGTASSTTSRVSCAVTVACVISCACLGLLEVYHAKQITEMRSQVRTLQNRLEGLEGLLSFEQFQPRSRRSVDAGDEQRNGGAIPVVDRPYGHQAGAGRRGDGLRVYHTLNGQEDPAPDDKSILPHHRSSAAFSAGRLGRVNTPGLLSAPPQALTQSTERPPAPPPPDVYHRRSRVPTRQTRRRGRHRSRVRALAGSRRAKARLAAEARGAPTGYAAGPQEDAGRHRTSSGRGHGRSKRLMRMMEQMRDSFKTTVAHFEAHTSNYSLDHPHYGGNGLLRNNKPNAMFSDWRPAAWMDQRGLGDDFKLYGGQVTVRRPGVYYLYAQINYLDDSDINGFEITVNARSFIKCLTMEASDHRQKVNTCHTGAVTYLNTGDSISIRDLEPLRISMFLPDRSFFGLFKLAGTG